MWWLKLAAYRLWRLRRVVLIELFAPWIAIWLVGRWDPAFDALLPMLFENGAHIRYGVFILAAAILFPVGAVSGLRVVTAFSLAIFLMPTLWMYGGRGGPAEGYFMEFALIATVLAWGLVLLSVRALNRATWPEEYRDAATIRIAAPPAKVFDGLKIAASDDPLNELMERIEADPDHPARYRLRYRHGATLQAEVAHRSDLTQTVILEPEPATGMREIFNLEVAADGDGAFATEVSRTTRTPLPIAVGLWLTDFLADRQVYVRDRIEGRRSLSIYATRVRQAARRGWLAQLRQLLRGREIEKK
jgi:hypothetical protein